MKKKIRCLDCGTRKKEHSVDKYGGGRHFCMLCVETRMAAAECGVSYNPPKYSVKSPWGDE